MVRKSTPTSPLQHLGILLFAVAMAVFTASLTFSHFALDQAVVREQLRLNVDQAVLDPYGIDQDYYWTLASPLLSDMAGQEYANSFTFMSALSGRLGRLQQAVEEDLNAKGLSPSGGGDYWTLALQDYRINDLKYPVAKASSKGFLPGSTWLVFLFSIGLGLLGAFLYILPKARHRPGIKNDHIYHSSMHHRGWLGIVTGLYLIGFYILLYFYPQHMVNWVILVDPVSEVLKGEPASQWFLYGFLYTLVILVMGVRMLIKYRHNRYQQVRTASVMFFQLCFAFLLPEILLALNQPSMDLKNIWPLDYDFFFGYNIDYLLSSGALGLFMLFWGIALAVVAVPVITYFYGKRWYCSWVCGCGGLAETLGDPYRQLSDKSLAAWSIERYMVHGVLVFALVMTALVLATYFTGNGFNMGLNRWILLLLIWALGGIAWYVNARWYPFLPKSRMLRVVGAIGGVLTIALLVGQFSNGSATINLSSFKIREWYGFYIGAGFAGVVGTGFYPFMGNRVWCRFGCPLAAYLGLVQRFKSRFRITTNGGQCISCGNCSTYCEMGIDVRWYAQRGQDVIRASCVGCGICSAVCPRGVLRLENSAADIDERAQALRAIHISKEGISLLP